ncbi:competence protein ComEC [Arthrobacter pigmenti]|uniref:Competence protein ComEC n=1 Tax=Arthrobacter pigmenti TaxID=271432 RepID=A0A846RQI6_9MICC|nr:competence protein ComEC [Arthrobacter pigmenti]
MAQKLSWLKRRSHEDRNVEPDETGRPVRDLRLLPAAVAAWIAAVLAVRLDAPAALMLGFVLTTVALGCMAFVGYRRKHCRILQVILVATGAAAMICLPTAARIDQQGSEPMEAAIASEGHITAKLLATGDASRASAPDLDGSPRWILEATLLEGTFGGERFTASIPLVVLGGDDWSAVKDGDMVRAAGKVTATDPGERARALMIGSTAPDRLEHETETGPMEQVRERFLTLAGSTGAPDDGLMAGMVIGARSVVAEDLVVRMQSTGLTHLTAVSGANCSYVLAFVFLSCRAFRLPRWAAALGGIVSLVAFVLLVRPEPSVLRAAVMGSIGVLAVLTGRGRLSMTLLFLSIAALLAVDPWLSGEYAFILSVAATSGLVLAGPLLVQRLETLLPRWIAQLLAVPLAAQLFCTPILILIQPAIPTYSLLANIAAAPVVPFITIAGMLAVMLVSLLPLAALPFAVAAGWGASWVAGVAGFFASAPLAVIPWPSGAGGAALSALSSLAVLAVAVWWQPLRAVVRSAAAKARSAVRGIRIRALKWVAAGFALGCAGLWAAAGAVHETAEWTIAGCDVGQGDGFVVRTGEHSAMVFDAGPDPALIDRCLDALQVETVDLLVITHLHQDHYGGIEGVFSDRPVRRLLYSTSEAALPDEVIEATTDAGLVPEPIVAGDTGALGSTTWTALWPFPDVTDASENDASAVVLVTTGGTDGRSPVDVLFTGDIEEEAADEMLVAHRDLTLSGVDILKVAHHGARNGGHRLIEATSPSVALISAGRHNDYGHPHPATLDALDAAGVYAARTDQRGSFFLFADDGTLRIRSL